MIEKHALKMFLKKIKIMNNQKLITTVRKGCNPTTFTHESPAFNTPLGSKPNLDFNFYLNSYPC